MRDKLKKAERKLMAIAALALFMAVGIAGTTSRPKYHNNFKNLKVLPQDISNEDLHKIMEQFNQALGVRCNYCHAQKDSSSKHLDFASDSNHLKDGARYMMRMTMQINKDYLQVKQPLIGDSSLVVTCYTCHRGSPFPDNKSKDTIPHKDFGPGREPMHGRDSIPGKDPMPH